MEEDRKRLSDAASPPPKRHQVNKDDPLCIEDIDLFQKESLFRQMQAYKRERDETAQQLRSLQSGDSDIQQELSKINQKYADAIKQLERAQSEVVSKIFNTSAKTDKSPEPNSVNNKSDENSASVAEVAELKLKIAGFEGENAKLQQFLTERDDSTSKLELRIADLHTELSVIPSANASLEQRLLNANNQIQNYDNQIKKLETEIADLKANEAEQNHSLKMKYDLQIQDLEKKLNSAEQDVLRIRSNRDELLSGINKLKAENAEHRNEAQRLKSVLETFEMRSRDDPKSNTEPSNSGENTNENNTIEIPDDYNLLKEKFQQLNRQKNMLANEMNAMEQAFSAAHQKAKQAIKDTAVAEQRLGVLNSAKVRSDEKYIGAMRAKDSCNAELQKTKQALQKSAEVLSDQRKQEQKLIAQISKLQRQVADAELQVSTKQREVEATLRSRAELEGHLQASKAAQSSLKEQVSKCEAEKFAAERARRASDIQVEKLNRQLEAQRAVSGLGSSAEVQEQIESLRSIAMCQVCQKNWKDSCISTCGHTMCGDCIKSRLAARMRNCPLCNGHFASADVLNIHL